VDQDFVPWDQLGEVSEVELLPDGGILVSGTFYTGAPFGFNPPRFVRLNSDGSVDANFTAGQRIARTVGDNNGIATDPGYVYTFLAQPDGKIVVVGEFSYVYTGPGAYVPRSCIVRFNADGTLDGSFNPGSGAAAPGGFTTVSAVALQKLGANEGKLVLYGYFDSFNGQAADDWVRLNSDGSVDGSFAAPSSAPYADGLTVQADDSVVVYGYASSPGAPPITRLQPNGGIDPGFNPPGDWREYDGGVTTVAQQADGKLIVGGAFRSLDNVPANNIVRLETNGARDLSFNSSIATGPYAAAVYTLLVRAQDGQIFVGGDFSTYGGAARNNFAWVNPAGSVSAAFAGLSGATERNPSVEDMAVQPDGKIVVVGNFTSVKGSPRYGIVRLNADFTVDSSFSATAGIEGTPRVVLLQPDGKIVVGGYRQPLNAFPPGILTRFNADGTRDSSFNPGTGANASVSALAEDGAGNIYVAGGFSMFNGQTRSRVVKLSSTGAVDPTFDPGLGADRLVNTIVFAPESNAILIGGDFLKYQGVSVGRIARLNATTAALDTSFNPGGTGFTSQVRKLIRDANGKYYAGSTGLYNNTSQGAPIYRLNSDGTRDQSFSPSSGFIQPQAIALQGDRVYAPMDYARVTRLTSTGAFDSSFNTPAGAGFSNAHYFSSFDPARISSLVVQPDGKLLVGGAFTTFNNIPRVCLVRLTDSKLNFSAGSRKTHGVNGPAFDVNLALAGAPAIESRSGGANGVHQLVFSFAGAVTIGNATVTSGSGNVSMVSGNGTSTVTVDLTGVGDAQRITLQLGNVSTGTSSADVSIKMGVLLGDSNSDGTVNAGDAQQTRTRSGDTLNLTNFRSDCNLDGSLNSGDATIVRTRSGQALPQ
jgi:uncharacterized delta-60 repeat protein